MSELPPSPEMCAPMIRTKYARPYGDSARMAVVPEGSGLV